jgi:Icc protein
MEREISTETNGEVVSWGHFGDLHITGESEQNYQDFLALIEQVNGNLAGGVDFAVLPGDNADDGTEQQFRLVKREVDRRRAVDRLRMPLHMLPGDHDRKPGGIEAFYKVLGAERLPRAITAAGHRCLFLDIVSGGSGGPDFRLGADQAAWLKHELSGATQLGQRSIVFMHAYPGELREGAEILRGLLARYHVVAVDMGHTHYNELANDGRTIYAATRSTGQVEEGPVGFSIAAIDHGVVGWRFKPLDTPWPFVVIASPADRRLVIDPEAADQVVRDRFEVRALVWSGQTITACSYRVDDGPWQAMSKLPDGPRWSAACIAPACDFRPTVRGEDAGGGTDMETIEVAAGHYEPPHRHADGSNADAVGAWPAKGILGTQLGPNRNGRKR